MIPKTLKEMNNAVKEASYKGYRSGQLNSRQMYSSMGKYVQHIRTESMNFVLASYRVYDNIINLFKQKDFLFYLSEAHGFNISPHDQSFNEDLYRENAQKFVKSNADNEFLGYRFWQACQLNVPEYHWIDDPKENAHHIVLEHVSGESLKNFSFEYMYDEKGLDHSLAAMVVTSNDRIHQKDVIVSDDQGGLTYLDPNLALERSIYWSHNIQESKELSIKLLDDFRALRTDEMVGDCIPYNEISDKDVLQSFLECKECLLADKSKYQNNAWEIAMYENVNARADACISYLQNKL